ncbi:MAG: hypothetical protein HYZ53_26190 [Planctomycetes bacterium]|nr:hypothetical protein [Planctomycetota bacterium]
MALVLVLVVLAALAVIATPFAVTMVQQDRIARNQVDEARARYAALGARNAAVAQLVLGHDTQESAARAAAPFDNPAVDTLAEVAPSLDFVEEDANARAAAAPPSADAESTTQAAPPRRRFRIRDPRGAIWGASAQDEQGKVNVRTAPGRVVSALRARAAALHVSPREFLTDASSVPSAWITPRTVRSTGVDPSAAGGPARWISVDESEWFGVGTRLRFWNGKAYLFGRVATSDGLLVLDGDFPGGYDADRLSLEAEARHPVNLNTAPREVLVALLDGLAWPDLQKKDSTYVLPRGTAELVADLIVAQEKGLGGWEDLGKLLAGARTAAGTPLRQEELSSIAANAVNPGLRLLGGSGTMPFAFAGGDVYRLDAVGLANDPAGNQAARYSFADTVEVAPSGPLTWSLSSQVHFDKYLTLRSHVGSILGGGGGGRPGARGEPFGHLVVTHPNRSWLSEEPDSSTLAGKGDVRLAAARDERGGGYAIEESFDQTHEGVDLGGKGLSYAPGKAIPVPPAGGDIGSGGFQAWWQFRGGVPTGVTLLDVAQAEWMNRLRVYVEGGELVLSASDACADELAAQVRAPFDARPDRWVHVGAFWKSNLAGHLLLTLDGLPAGRFTYYSGRTSRAEMTTLTTDLAVGSTGLALSNQWAQTVGGQVVQLGDEAIELPPSGAAVRGARGTIARPHPAGSLVAPFGYANPLISFNVPVPGGTFGLDRIPATAGRVREGFGVKTFAQLPPPPPSRPGVRPPPLLLKTATVIPVVAGPGGGNPTDDFPSRGILLVGVPGSPTMELVYYESKSAASFQVGANGRGVSVPLLATQAQDHQGDEPVVLFSLPVDGVSTNYCAPGSSGCLVQIDDEWMFGAPFFWPPTSGAGGAGAGAGGGKEGYLVGLTAVGAYYLPPGVPTGFGRAFAYTLHAPHAAGALVLPVFAVRDGPARDPNGPGPSAAPYGKLTMQAGAGVVDQGLCGAGDVVTLDEADPQPLPKEQATVRQSRSLRLALGGTLQTIANFVALSAPVSRDHVAAPAGAARLLKFPSGDLAASTPGPTWVGAGEKVGKPGTPAVTGLVDEVRFTQAGRGDFRLDQAVAAGDPAVRIAIYTQGGGGGQLGFVATGGAIKLEDEVLGYASFADVGTRSEPAPSGQYTVRLVELSGCERGFLKTKAVAHGVGARVFNLTFFSVGALGGAISATSASFGMSAPAPGQPQGFPREGYVLLGEELLGYTRNTGKELRMPTGRDGVGLWRGAFGTLPAAHGLRELAYAMPFRYWDRSRPRVEDDTQACYQIERRATGALWKRLTWQARCPDPRLVVRALVRLDGRPAWDQEPTGKPGGLWEFKDGDGKNRLDARGDRIEVRFLFEYLDGAYAAGAWKDTPALDSVKVEFEQPTVTHLHEE